MSDSKRLCITGDPIIVTHSGVFHADDALAVSLLTKLPSLRDAQLIRTRDPAQIERGSVVVDVGAEYDPERHRYDHHQRGFFETFSENHKIKLSSAGLVWKHFGRDILLAYLGSRVDERHVDILYTKMYDDFVEAIDAIDNGISQYPEAAGAPAYRSRTDLSSRVGFLVPRWNEESNEAILLERFRKASELAGSEFFERVDYTVDAWLPARNLVIDALEQRTKFEGADSRGRILLFDQATVWKSHIFTVEEELAIEDKPLYVVYPDESKCWRVQAIPVSLESFESRRALPDAWRGLRDNELSELSKIPDCIFVHSSGFIGGNKTREGALEMARRALE
ncbi:hypothetical protein MCUN1_003608 [Malassezia cuniculi]|uniref:Metal-dependent protein hydrolase n=1 Tax=Malassezia cuniculi TaxID=948313 RepID=A0AAF0JDA4_9BASI|nr:hypothetical protein MCUN1_003608 [Malassezia cuniculi]